MAEPDFSGVGHPRLLFNAETLPRLRELARTNPDTRSVVERMTRRVREEILTAPWWDNLPTNDRAPLEKPFYQVAGDLVEAAFLYVLTEDPDYAPVVPMAVQFARYPKGGRSSPQHAQEVREGGEDATQITEFMALLYDWLYPHFTEAERADFVHSLDWRIEHFVFHFAWMRTREDGRRQLHGSSLGFIGASHAQEGFFDTFPAAVAVYEDSENARYAFHLGVNFMAGVGSAHGFSEGWNEGPGYGNSKWAWQINAMAYFDSIFPDYGVARNNPWVDRTGAFLRLTTPVGLKHAPWGHNSNRTGYFVSGHRRGYRKLAFLTGDGRFLANWEAYGWSPGDDDLSRPWIEAALPLWRKKPAPVMDEPHVRAFPRSGWVFAMSGPPSDPGTYDEGLGIIFSARPRGAYSHSFGSDNSFHLFGYGQDLSHAAGSSAYDAHSYHSMSHNTVLVDGLAQYQGRSRQTVPYAARLIAFHEGDDVAYWCGDATLAYPREPGRVRHWWGELDGLYETRDARHLQRYNRHVLFVRDRYVVILDDLAASRPSRFSWLYHVLPDSAFTLDKSTGSFAYSVGDVRVHVTHLLGAGTLDVVNQRGMDGYINPITGEDYTPEERRRRREPMVARHNVYVTNRRPAETWRFLSVIVPVPPASTQSPHVERIDDLTLRVTAFGSTDVITFDPNRSDADIVVDLPAIAKAGLHP